VQRFDREAGDVIYIPLNTIHQHFNADLARPARLISATNRLYVYCGLDDLEQLDDAPEYDPSVVLDAETVRSTSPAGWSRPVGPPHESSNARASR
jgi:hypothetical protein